MLVKSAAQFSHACIFLQFFFVLQESYCTSQQLYNGNYSGNDVKNIWVGGSGVLVGEIPCSAVLYPKQPKNSEYLFCTLQQGRRWKKSLSFVGALHYSSLFPQEKERRLSPPPPIRIRQPVAAKNIVEFTFSSEDNHHLPMKNAKANIRQIPSLEKGKKTFARTLYTLRYFLLSPAFWHLPYIHLFPSLRVCT